MLCILLLTTSCEQTLPYIDEVQQDSTLVVNAVAVTDTVLSVTVSYARTLDQIPHVSSADFWSREASDTSTYRLPLEVNCSDATVEAWVNGSHAVTFEYDVKSRSYISDYCPKPGDYIDLAVSKEKNSGFVTAKASTIVPAHPSIEVLDYTEEETTIVLDTVGDFDNSPLPFDDRTYMRLTCKINDPAGNNYYRLLVRVVGDVDPWYYSTYKKGVAVADVFHSEDPLFIDNRLSKNYGGWPAYFSNVFDDHLFNGTSYTFSVSSYRKNLHCKNHRVYLELQEISKDFYYYLKSMQVYRITDLGDFSEALQIHSNVEKGWGIFGSLTGTRIVIPFK